jgi:hypothetical protein
MHVMGKRSISTTAEIETPFIGFPARTLARIFNGQGWFVHTMLKSVIQNKETTL